MEIKVRDVDPVALKKIDELAKKQKMSRNEYLKRTIESFSILTAQDTIINRLEKQLEANSILMAETSNTLNELVAVLKELIVDE